MNEGSRWRLAIGQRVASVIAANPKVQAIMVAGSTSRGCADRYSDIEIAVFWSSPPSDEERMAPILPAGGVFWELDPYDEEHATWMEEWGIGGLKIDMRNRTVEGMERILSEVIDHYDTSSFKQEAISAVQYAIPLYNVPLSKRWKEKLARYPDELRRVMVQENLLFYEWRWWMETLIFRGDIPLFYNELSEAVFQALRMLIGLNGIYYPGKKWMDRLVDEMRIVPANLAVRIKTAFHVEPRLAAKEVKNLILEIYDLVDIYLPEVSTVEARRLLARQRAQFEEPPV